MRKPRIIVAGQVPPPMGGQNAMVQELLLELRSSGRCRVDHLAFRFTPDTRSARKGGLSKMVELMRVLARLTALRSRGKIDLMVFPPGGPQTVPLFRDLLLMPWILACSSRVLLHFHAAGIADALQQDRPLAKRVAHLYSGCGHALVMTDFNKRDPVACGIKDIRVAPHQLPDSYDPDKIVRGEAELRLLAMGHICPDKGVPTIIRAVAALHKNFPNLKLVLAGEPLAPYTHELLQEDLRRFGMEEHVELLGIVTGEAKSRAFASADLFLFPSVAPYESFGLVMIEAMMWGLPILASDWRGNPDVLGATAGGFTFSPADSEQALSEALRQLLDRKAEWPALGQRNRETFLERFSKKEGSPSPLCCEVLTLAANT